MDEFRDFFFDRLKNFAIFFCNRLINFGILSQNRWSIFAFFFPATDWRIYFFPQLIGEFRNFFRAIDWQISWYVPVADWQMSGNSPRLTIKCHNIFGSIYEFHVFTPQQIDQIPLLATWLTEKFAIFTQKLLRSLKIFSATIGKCHIFRRPIDEFRNFIYAIDWRITYLSWNIGTFAIFSRDHLTNFTTFLCDRLTNFELCFRTTEEEFRDFFLGSDWRIQWFFSWN